MRLQRIIVFAAVILAGIADAQTLQEDSSGQWPVMGPNRDNTRNQRPKGGSVRRT